jgi:hypothetical protein
MFQITVVLILLVFAPQFCSGGPLGIPAYHSGEPILIELHYDGSIDGWDGEITVGKHKGHPRLSMGNSAIFVVTKGRQDFVPFHFDSTNVRLWWQAFSAKHGELVPPLKNRITNPAYNIALTGPFTTLLDVASYYELKEPGIYNIYWGVEKLWTQEIVFRVLPVGMKPGTKRCE